MESLARCGDCMFDDELKSSQTQPTCSFGVLVDAAHYLSQLKTETCITPSACAEGSGDQSQPLGMAHVTLQLVGRCSNTTSKELSNSSCF